MQRTAKAVCLALTLCALALTSVTHSVFGPIHSNERPAVVAGDEPKPAGGSG
ncbi:hypothetical protein DES52_12043 [Deinococcus yavapaiensis KR-236]|uniref:Uncharacterized protein n=1 Tax=Deinococcus yavapaiensis KR-236 TaxID=694435 RepID=A0A318S2S5_9DEIO|nr:hypothetical protein DES52_12043 [Deinococcus yavapaiensis KR-236]